VFPTKILRIFIDPGLQSEVPPPEATVVALVVTNLEVEVGITFLFPSCHRPPDLGSLHNSILVQGNAKAFLPFSLSGNGVKGAPPARRWRFFAHLFRAKNTTASLDAVERHAWNKEEGE
jgi:hypothetical protein